MKILNFILFFYQKTFVRPIFYRAHFFLYHLSLRGMGILNYQDNVSGEKELLKNISQNFKIKTAFDVGAHIGGYSKKLLKTFPAAKIYAFEPHPKNYKVFKKFHNSKNLHIENLALGSKKNKLKLFDYSNNQKTSQHASMIQNVIEEVHRGKSKHYTVSVKTLDSFCSSHKISKIDFLKIDTEGTEMEVLLGAKKLLKKNLIKFIQFEFNSMNAIGGIFLRDFRVLLKNHQLYRVLPTGLIKLSTDPVRTEIFAFQNILAVPRTSVKKIKNTFVVIRD